MWSIFCSHFSSASWEVISEQDVVGVGQRLEHLMNQLLFQSKFIDLLNQAVAGLIFETKEYRYNMFKKQVLEFLKANS
ncbi:MAG: hypothetical protein K0M45_03795 [Candidatus Paracaedibacteraceae bacterium]|nr:hypothetical protein [Candidatus Paracaedibacteraceae bacterium]